MLRLIAHWLAATFVVIGVLSAPAAMASPACAENPAVVAMQPGASGAHCALCTHDSATGLANPASCCVSASFGAAAAVGTPPLSVKVTNAAAAPTFFYSSDFGRLLPAPPHRPPRAFTSV